jgi:hypothetical protein
MSGIDLENGSLWIPLVLMLSFPTKLRAVSGRVKMTRTKQREEKMARNQKMEVHPRNARSKAPRTGPMTGAVLVLKRRLSKFQVSMQRHLTKTR